MTTLDFAPRPVSARRSAGRTDAAVHGTFLTHGALVRPGIAMVQLNDDLWRVTRPTGEVLGYIERFDESGDDRFRAKRLSSSTRASLPLGEFWRMDDAVDCFRFN